MRQLQDLHTDIPTMARLLEGRYGSLALTRAAGAAAAAARQGDGEGRAMWSQVITHLRQGIVVCKIS